MCTIHINLSDILVQETSNVGDSVIIFINIWKLLYWKSGLIVSCSPDAVVDPWIQTLWDRVLAVHPIPPGMTIVSCDVM